MKVLLVEDEPELRRSIRMYLQEEGFMVESANEFPAAMEKAQFYSYDAVLVDITLPKGSGLDIVRVLRERDPATGIIIISAKGSLDDKILGLDLGADDYLPKPFHLPELVARLRALIRRKQFAGKQAIELDELRIKPEEKLVEVNGERIDLTVMQFDLLLFLVANKDRVLSRSAIVEHVWGDMAERLDHDNFLYSHMKNLRKKLLEKGSKDRIQTVYGLGYRLSTKA
ncbi:MAG TPA: response regulator transcription factor [Flavobacteriales bacterium]|nr:response regulator transcription factor [Flavobacteriales bacterium]MCC6938192.1 response regulator transcription factor [Flavobacteriales bacterium]HNE81251.1 response regulator transcription factor [Flavobacteriales bacterium]HNI05829.1 response regulator transcription factor [Flavobacteriales bacterium]HNK84985.1 response regulator transcription factor [Flavobacteriales bacterium]